MLKKYVCNYRKELTITRADGGPEIKFAGGFYQTDDEAGQALIEGHRWFGIHIRHQDVLDPEPQEDFSLRVRRGMRGTR